MTTASAASGNGSEVLYIDKALVTGGKLVVSGLAPRRDQQVKLDGRFTVTSDADKGFRFAISTYLPASCVVGVTAGTATGFAVVANCGRGLNPRGPWTAGASYLVVGRPIIAAADPRAAAERIDAECRAAARLSRSRSIPAPAAISATT